MKVLLINQTFYPDAAASAQLLTDLALALRKDKHEVTVLTSACGYVDAKGNYSRKEDYQGIQIHRVSPLVSSKRNKLGKIINGLSMNLAFAWKLLWFKRFDKIVCLTSPPLIAWVALHVAKTPRRGFIYWVMDINPDQAIEAGWLTISSPIAKVLEWTLRSVLEKAEKTIVLDRHMKERLLAKGVDENKVVVSHLWADRAQLHSVPHDENRFREKHGLEDKFVVMYAGNLSICHPLNTVLEAAEVLREDESTMFVFLGGGARVDEVLDFKRQRVLNNVIYLPYENPFDGESLLRDALSAGDVHVISMGEPYVGIVHPSKIYGIMAVSRTPLLVGPEETFINERVLSAGIGHRVDHGDVQGFIERLEQAKALSEGEKRELETQITEVSKEFCKVRMTTSLAQLVMS